MYSTSSTIRGAMYASSIRCAALSDLFKLIDQHLMDLRLSNEPPLIALNTLGIALSGKYKGSSVIAEEEALCAIVADELTRISATVSAIEPERHSQDHLSKTFQVIKDSFKRFGLSANHVNFELVDSFPTPYDDLDFHAMNNDATDLKMHGISPAVRLKRKHLLPVFSETVLAHEVTHAVLGKKEDNRLARGLEEGIADLFGRLLISSYLMPWDWCVNIVRNTRLRYPQSQSKMNYSEALRQALLLYLTNGLPYILSAVVETQLRGREWLKSLEEHLLQGEIPNIGNSISQVSDEFQYLRDLKSFAIQFIGYPQSLVVGPLAYFIAERIKPGDFLLEFVARENLNKEAALRAVEELKGDKAYLLVLDKRGKVSFNESKLYMDVGALRYSPTT